MTRIGGVRASLEGDATSWMAAAKAAREGLQQLSREAGALKPQVDQVVTHTQELERALQRTSKAARDLEKQKMSLKRELNGTKEKLANITSTMNQFVGMTGMASGAVGKFGGMAASAFGTLATGGPIGLAVATFGAGVIALHDHFGAAAEEARAFGAAVQSAVLDRRQSMAATLEEWERKVAALGKTSSQAALDQMKAQETAAITSLALSKGALAQLQVQESLHGLDKPSLWADPMDRWKWKVENERLREKIGLQREVVKADEEVVAGMKKVVPLAEQAANFEEKRAHHAKKIEEATKGTFRSYGEGVAQVLRLQRELEGKTEVSRDEWLSDYSGGTNDGFRSSGEGIAAALRFQRELEGKTEISEAEWRRAGSSFADEAQRVWSKGGIGGLAAASPLFSMGMEISSKITDAIQAGFTKVADAAGKGLDFFLGSSKFGGLGGTGSQAAAGIIGGALASSAGTAAMPAAWPMLPVVAAAGGGAAGGAMFADVMMRATLETKSYQRTMSAFNGIFLGAVHMMEPAFATFAPSIGLLGVQFRDLSQTVRPMAAALSDELGEALFNATKGAAFTMMQFVVQADASMIGMMKMANAFNWFAYTVFQQTPGMADLATGFLESYNMGVAGLETQLDRHGDLMAQQNAIASMTIHEGNEYFDGLSRLTDRTNDVSSSFAELGASMRNIPEFINRARLARLAGEGTTGIIGGGLGGAAPGAAGGNSSGTRMPGGAVIRGGNNFTFHVETIEAAGATVFELADQLSQMAYQMTGVPNPTGPAPRAPRHDEFHR